MHTCLGSMHCTWAWSCHSPPGWGQTITRHFTPKVWACIPCSVSCACMLAAGTAPFPPGQQAAPGSITPGRGCEYQAGALQDILSCTGDTMLCMSPSLQHNMVWRVQLAMSCSSLNCMARLQMHDEQDRVHASFGCSRLCSCSPGVIASMISSGASRDSASGCRPRWQSEAGLGPSKVQVWRACDGACLMDHEKPRAQVLQVQPAPGRSGLAHNSTIWCIGMFCSGNTVLISYLEACTAGQPGADLSKSRWRCGVVKEPWSAWHRNLARAASASRLPKGTR